MQQEGKIRIKAMCLIFYKGKILASKGFDEKKEKPSIVSLGEALILEKKPKKA